MIKYIRQVYYIFKRKVGEILFKSDDVINKGERYEPFLTSFLYNDTCHIPRYQFASKYLSDKDNVLDIACGTGYGSAILAGYCLKVTGVDISKKAVDYASKKNMRLNTKFIVSDFFDYNDVADTVISFETIEHIKVDNIDSILLKLISYSRKMVIGSIPYKETPGSNEHHYLFNLDESNLKCIESYGDTKIYYQTRDGIIHDSNPGSSVQNLIFVFTKNNTTTIA